MQRTTRSDGGRLVDWEVRRALGCVVLWEVVPLRVKVDFLEGCGLVAARGAEENVRGGDEARGA